MTAEQQHVFKYLKDFLTKNYKYLSEYAKREEITKKPYKNKEQLIKLIESDVFYLDWYFTECLRCHVDKNILKQLEVFEDPNEEYTVYEINNKLIKVWFVNFDAQYQFVETKDFDKEFLEESLQSIVDKLTKENELLKLKLSKYENN
jgi:hypothetical protein